ncbi:putative low-complexity protein [Candidatus Rickettsiella viridis]|uniref:Putative low-complexity protein n=1 Tax=Candidatus Rickettsiella viridis TaxID=676208 RepID=A0A2Z5UUG0_9COXI|nr:pentapeptide repeat-containing protein [Candidatus Rickettsiella viridis]BBB15286.1 putative low-complexity protein [Candidatus Rickettsiella viridis]
MVRKLPKEHAEPFSFPNHLLSKKLLSFNDYPENNAHCIDIDVRIKNVYGYDQRSPIYYNERLNDPEAIDHFIHSEEFNILITELKICIDYINDWALEKKIVFKWQQDASQSTASSVLTNFLHRLQGEAFSWYRTYLYSEGKKNLEIIAALIRDESISLEFRKEVIVLLLDENNFNRCVAACLTNLSDAAEKLRSNDHFLPIDLIKSFIVIMAREVALSNSLHDSRSYSAVLCAYTGRSIANYEIHAVNYLCERLKFDLRLYFLDLPNDPYVDEFIYTLEFSKFKKPGQEDSLYVQYFHEFERRFNATNLVRFMSYRLYESCSTYLGDYQALQTFIESQLIKLGNDAEFSWAEIFTEEGGLKTVDDFMITIAERLLDSKWLEFTPIKSNNPLLDWFKVILGAYQAPVNPTLNITLFRIYPNNIALSWVKREDRREALLDVLTTEEGVEWLNSHIFSDPKNLNDLLQNIQDLILFFKYLPESLHLNILEKLAIIGFDIPSILVDKLDESISFIDFYTLFTGLSSQGKEFFISHYSKLVYSILDDILQQVEDLNHNKVLSMINWFIRRIIKAGFRDFSGIRFKKRDIRYDTVERASYLDNIDFSNTILSNVEFYEAISNCLFLHANLQGVIFIDTRISDTNFSYAKFSKCTFERAYLSAVNAIGANVKDTDILNSSLIRVVFNAANLKHVNFVNTEIISAYLKEAKLSYVHLRRGELIDTLFEGTQLNGVSFDSSEMLGIDFNRAHLSEVDFSTSELVSVQLTKSIITNITLSASQLYLLCKQGISNFSKVRLASNWRSELTFPRDSLKFFSRVMNSSNNSPHFFCCKKRNFPCLDKNPIE